MNLFDMSLTWKFFDDRPFCFYPCRCYFYPQQGNLHGSCWVELGVIIAWLIGMVGYAILAYFVRHTRRP